jgi:hypothetical protein
VASNITENIIDALVTKRRLGRKQSHEGSCESQNNVRPSTDQSKMVFNTSLEEINLLSYLLAYLLTYSMEQSPS